MHCSYTLRALITLVISLTAVTALAQRQTREDIERQFLYGWSASSTLIFSGTVASVDYQNDPRSREPTVEVVARIDALQRGNPGNNMVRIRIDDELQTYGWANGTDRVGESGIWFLFRVRTYEGREPLAYLVRYMDRDEIEQDPQFLAELMRFVVQESVDQIIKPNVLNLLSLGNDPNESATIKLDLKYDDYGTLSEIQIVERSPNSLYNDHVYDTVLQLHRRIRIPGGVKETQIEITRSLL